MSTTWTAPSLRRPTDDSILTVDGHNSLCSTVAPLIILISSHKGWASAFYKYNLCSYSLKSHSTPCTVQASCVVLRTREAHSLPMCNCQNDWKPSWADAIRSLVVLTRLVSVEVDMWIFNHQPAHQARKRTCPPKLGIDSTCQRTLPLATNFKPITVP